MQLIIPIHRSANKTEAAGRNSFIVAAGVVPAGELNYFEPLSAPAPIHINAQGCNKRQRRATHRSESILISRRRRSQKTMGLRAEMQTDVNFQLHKTPRVKMGRDCGANGLFVMFPMAACDKWSQSERRRRIRLSRKNEDEGNCFVFLRRSILRVPERNTKERHAN